MTDVVLTAVAILLLLNLLAAIVASLRRGTGRWLLVILLTGTTGTALIALLAVLTDGPAHRFVEAGLVLMGLAALTAVVRLLTPRARGRAAS